MNIKKTILGLVLAVSCLVSSALAQDQDLYSKYTPLLLGTPGLLAANALATTNGAVDVFGTYGRGFIVINTSTNAGGTLNFALQQSVDTTNWLYVPNAAITSASLAASYTNLYYFGTNLVVTNTWLAPYTVSSTSAASAGYATPTRVPFVWTNTLNGTSVSGNGQPVVIGINLTDNTRYLRAIWTATAGATNASTYVSAILIANRQTYPGLP